MQSLKVHSVKISFLIGKSSNVLESIIYFGKSNDNRKKIQKKDDITANNPNTFQVFILELT